MDLKGLAIGEKKANQLKRAGITSVEDLLYTYPRKYRDRTALTGIQSSNEESILCVVMRSIRKIDTRNKRPILKATCFDITTQCMITVLWFNQEFLWYTLKDYVNTRMILAGNLTFVPANQYDPDHFQCSNPSLFAPEDKAPLRIYPEYKKIPGMSAEFYSDCVRKSSYLVSTPKETMPTDIAESYHLVCTRDMVNELHWPTSVGRLQAAKHRLMWDDLVYFALRIALNYINIPGTTPFILKDLGLMQTVRNELTFELTPDQSDCLNDCIRRIHHGQRLNALIQGDVGCGKTIIAILLMIAFVENGYQAVIMAPTQILAQQHFDTIKQLVERYGISVAFVSGQKLRKKEQVQLEAGLADGSHQIIVGTQALLSESYRFSNLGLVIEDEEHKYGVLQKNALSDKAAKGTHIITMSATPIPRTLAQTIYGDSVQLFSIRTKPHGRQVTRTGIKNEMPKIYQFLTEIVRMGHQAYVVCPMVSPSEKVAGVATAEETFRKYKEVLQENGIRVGLVTGKTAKKEAQQILTDFEENRISILVCTTIIEVGVNIPNANTIVIHNAERFGLAQLHQLRGRVGRGTTQGYCVLISDDINNPRLRTMCRYSDGFAIAEMDLQQRGAGDLIGQQQSGIERYLAMAIQNPDIYREAQLIAQHLLENGITCPLTERAYQDHNNLVGGEIVSN